MKSSQDPRASVAVTAFAGFFLKLVASGTLTMPVTLVFAALLFAEVNIFGPDIPFTQNLIRFIPADANGRTHIGPTEIMRVYSLLTAVLFVLSLALKILKYAIWPDKTDVEKRRSFFRKLIPVFSIITIIYSVALLTIPIAVVDEESVRLIMLILFLVFYVMSLGASAFFIVINGLANRVLRQAWTTYRTATVYD